MYATLFYWGLAVIMTMSNAMATKNTELTGYREGAKVIEVHPVRNQIDAITGVVYSQITTLRSVRPLHMSLLVPRTDAVKPAIVYFPGGGLPVPTMRNLFRCAWRWQKPVLLWPQLNIVLYRIPSCAGC